MSHDGKKPLYAIMNGMRYPEMFSPKCFKEAMEYKAQPGDVFIVTYPKCGTTWMQNIALYIFRKGRELDDIQDFFKLTPFIDMTGNEGISRMPKPGAFKTHLPYNYMTYSPEAKYIFVARDPRDCCVSFYNHAKSRPGFGFWNGEFDVFFEYFMKGEVEYNDYFDHMLSWYPHRNDPNVFYTTFEDMKKDTRSVVIKLAKFLGKEYIDAIEKDNGVLENILLYSGYDYMKKHFSKLYNWKEKKDPSDHFEGLRYLGEFVKSLNPPKELTEPSLVRKGIVGDWKNYFTADQLERLNKKLIEKFKDTDLFPAVVSNGINVCI